MTQSIRESNAWGAALHLAIHTNAGGGSGPLVMVYSKAPGNLKYAQPVYDALLTRSARKKGYGVRVGTEMTAGNYMPAELSGTNAVAVYCECEFHDQEPLAKWIVANVDGLGEAIAKGICKADNRTYQPEKPSVPKAPQTVYPRAGRRLLRKSKCGCPGKAPETRRIQTDCEGGYAEILTIFCARP